MDTKAVLARNIKALMARSADLKTPRKLAPRCTTAIRKVGARTIAHLLDPKSTVQPQLDTIVAIAEAFKVAPWLLLMPDFDPDKKSPKQHPSPEVIALAERILVNRDALSDVFGKAVPDSRSEDILAPAMAQQTTKTKAYEYAAKRRR